MCICFGGHFSMLVKGKYITNMICSKKKKILKATQTQTLPYEYIWHLKKISDLKF